MIVTGASRGIGATIVQAFLDQSYDVVANSLSLIEDEAAPAPNLALVKGDIGKETTAEKIAETFGSIDHVVNNAGHFVSKPFTRIQPKTFASSARPISEAV